MHGANMKIARLSPKFPQIHFVVYIWIINLFFFVQIVYARNKGILFKIKKDVYLASVIYSSKMRLQSRI
jgi:hypothetical protein